MGAVTAPSLSIDYHCRCVNTETDPLFRDILLLNRVLFIRPLLKIHNLIQTKVQHQLQNMDMIQGKKGSVLFPISVICLPSWMNQTSQCFPVVFFRETTCCCWLKRRGQEDIKRELLGNGDYWPLNWNQPRRNQIWVCETYYGGSNEKPRLTPSLVFSPCLLRQCCTLKRRWFRSL